MGDTFRDIRIRHEVKKEPKKQATTEVLNLFKFKTFPPPGYRPDTGIEPMFLAAPGLTGILFTTEPPKKPPIRITIVMS